MITQSELKELLHYDLETGIFTWLVAKSRRVKIGSVAGCISRKNCKNYIEIRINWVLYSAHRLAFLYVQGKFPDDETDHINGCGTDNKWLNLREVSRDENRKNRRKPSNNTSGVCGVHWDKKKRLWKATIRMNKKSQYIGRFKSISEAASARKNAEIKLGFHKNHGTQRPL